MNSAAFDKSNDDGKTPSRVDMKTCFHCLEPLPKYGTVMAEISGQERAFCCYGCQAAAQYIEKDQLGEFYQRRDRSANTANRSEAAIVNKVEADWSFLDVPELSKDYVTTFDDGERELSMHVHGIYCASCAWLISNALQKYSTDIESQLDVDAKRLTVRLTDPGVRISAVLEIIEKLGYQPSIVRNKDGFDSANSERQQQRLALKRITVAGFGMMQVMTYMMGVYFGEFQGMDASFHRFLVLVTMLVATWVVFYSGKPFFENAWNDITNWRLGMDVPIALAIGGAYFPSVYLTLLEIDGHIYFDSAVMFIFFLSVGRYVEARARHRLSGPSNQLAALLPPLIPVNRAGQTQYIKPEDSQVGDRVHLAHRQRLPFDGTVVAGETLFDESLISGESLPVNRQQGERVLAGSIVLGDAIDVVAMATWHESSIARISRLLGQATAAQNAQTTTFDYLARYFVIFVLALTAVVALVWWSVAPERVFQIVLAMLVASCPCAFALAGPVGVAAASHALRLKGLLITNFKALRILPKVTVWCFDKTGTLTRGKPAISSIIPLGELSKTEALQIAASLEQHSRHTLSYAFASARALLPVSDFKVVVGNGVTGRINDQDYLLGKPAWVVSQLPHADISNAEFNSQKGDSIVALADKSQLLALFYIEDQLRPQSKGALRHLKNLGYKLHMMSGDRQAAVDAVADSLPLDSAKADLLPEHKLDELHSLQAQSEVVAMVGDGINDAPVISQADVSLAMSTGSEVSQAQADVIILNGQLNSLDVLVRVASTTQRVTYQNMWWALAYNGIALPLAAFGLITPWLAALGMSLSSLLVVLNALRISRVTEQGLINTQKLGEVA